MRPKPRVIMPSTVSRIISMGDSIIMSSAAIQSSRDQSRKSPGSGPSALLSRISGAGQAASAAARPSLVVMSPATVVTLTPVAAAISAPVCFERVALARHDGDVDAFVRERERAGLAEPSAGATQQRLPAANAEVH